jgi:hypothetical protein
MHAIRRRLRACTWVALVAMAALAVGPTISRLTLPEAAAAMAMQHAALHHVPVQQGSMDGDAVAMADGAATTATHAHHHHHPPAALGNVPPAAPPGHTHSLEHCALCVVALFALAVAPPPLQVSTPAGARMAALRLRDDGSSPGRDTWSPIGSRGPPALA